MLFYHLQWQMSYVISDRFLLNDTTKWRFCSVGSSVSVKLVRNVIDLLAIQTLLILRKSRLTTAHTYDDCQTIVENDLYKFLYSNKLLNINLILSTFSYSRGLYHTSDDIKYLNILYNQVVIRNLVVEWGVPVYVISMLDILCIYFHITSFVRGIQVQIVQWKLSISSIQYTQLLISWQIQKRIHIYIR